MRVFSFTSTFDIKTGLAIVDSTDKQHCGTWNLENCKVQVFQMKIDGCVYIDSSDSIKYFLWYLNLSTPQC